MTLDEIGLKYNTDKASWWHNYTKVYHDYFKDKRHIIKNLLEIGVLQGSSLKMWHDYFEQADIVGVDIDENCKQYENNRIKVIIADATKPIKLPHKQYDVIIDDGSHISQDVINTFEWLFDKVASGGVYIVEDTHCFYFEEFSKPQTKPAIDYFKRLIDHVNFNGMRGKYYQNNRTHLIEMAKKDNVELSKWTLQIKSITFYLGLIFIEKL